VASSGISGSDATLVLLNLIDVEITHSVSIDCTGDAESSYRGSSLDIPTRDSPRGEALSLPNSISCWISLT